VGRLKSATEATMLRIDAESLPMQRVVVALVTGLPSQRIEDSRRHRRSKRLDQTQ